MDENLSRGYMQLSLDAPRVSTAPRRGSKEAIFFEPRDRCSAVYLSLVLCGAGFLLPYNSFITAVDYYQNRFPGTTIIFDISLTYICVAFFGVLTNNLLVDVLKLQTRVTFGYIVAFIVLSFVAICDVWLQLFQHDFSYTVTLVAVAIVAFASTVQQSSFYGYTSMLPARYTQAVMTGESAAGLITSINRILTKAFLPGNPQMNTILFFAISIAMLILCSIIFHVSRKSNFVRYHLNMCKMARLPEHERGFTNPCHEEVSLVDILDGQSTHAVNHNYGILRMNSSPSPPPDGVSESSNNPDEYTYTYQRGCDNIFEETENPQVKHKTNARGGKSFFQRQKSICIKLKEWCVARFDVSKSIYPYMFSICCAYLVTLSLFPGIESEVVSCRLHTWMPVILMALFNATDFIGKIIASIKYNWPRGRLFLLTSLRIFLIPLLMLCVMPRSKPILRHEAWSMTLSSLLGISNGYFGSVPMILAPSRVSDSHRELTGNIMTLSYSIGLTSGSGIAYALDSLLGPKLSDNPCVPFNTTDVTTTMGYDVTSTKNIASTVVSSATTAIAVLTERIMNTTLYESTTRASTIFDTTYISTLTDLGTTTFLNTTVNGSEILAGGSLFNNSINSIL